MLLIKLVDEQIAAYWDIIRVAIQKSLPPVAHESPEKMNNILQEILLGRIQVWCVSPDPEMKQVRTLVTTTILIDGPSKTRSLLIYSLYSFTSLGPDEMDCIFEGLYKWAKANSCNRAIAYTDQDNVISMAEKYGGRAAYTMLTFDL